MIFQIIGKVASNEQAEEVHKHIRGWLDAEISKDISDATRIIYGGSVTEKNSTELLKQKNIDGFLVFFYKFYSQNNLCMYC